MANNWPADNEIEVIEGTLDTSKRVNYNPKLYRSKLEREQANRRFKLEWESDRIDPLCLNCELAQGYLNRIESRSMEISTWGRDRVTRRVDHCLITMYNLENKREREESFRRKDEISRDRELIGLFCFLQKCHQQVPFLSTQNPNRVQNVFFSMDLPPGESNTHFAVSEASLSWTRLTNQFGSPCFLVYNRT